MYVRMIRHVLFFIRHIADITPPNFQNVTLTCLVPSWYLRIVYQERWSNIVVDIFEFLAREP